MTDTDFGAIANNVFGEDALKHGRLSSISGAVRVIIATERYKLREDPNISYPIYHTSNDTKYGPMHEYIICCDEWASENDDVLTDYELMFAEE